MTHNYRQYVRILLIISTAFLVVVLWIILGHHYPSGLVVNEVSFNNNNGNDWIELYNPSLTSVSLKGYYLTDSNKKLTKFKITDDIVVPRHGYIVFYGKRTDEVGEGLRLPFNIGNGETIYLVANDGVTIIDRLTVVKSENDIESLSIGRFPDGNTEVFIFKTATPGSRNDKDEQGEAISLPAKP